MEPIETLSRINHDSPYSKEHPIRKIYGIETITIQAGYCGHCCVAMLAGVPLSDVIVLMGKGHASWSKILEALDYYGISYASSYNNTNNSETNSSDTIDSEANIAISKTDGREYPIYKVD